MKLPTQLPFKLPAGLALRPRLLYGIFAALAFVVALRWTFPTEAVRERLIYEAGKAGWQIDVQDVGPAGLLGVRMDEVTLTDAAGLKLPVERLDASLRVLPLLLGRRSLAYQASVFGGTVEGRADLSGSSRTFRMALEGVNLKAVPMLRRSGVEFTGVAAGTIDLTMPGDQPHQASGTVDLSVAQAGVAGGNATIPPFSTPMTIPPISFGTVTAAGKADKGRLTMDKFQFRGGDAEVTGEGLVLVMQQRLQYAPVVGKLSIRFSPQLWGKPVWGGYKPMIDAALMNARAPDGSYQYQLFGNLSSPQARPVGAGGGGPPPPMPAQ